MRRRLFLAALATFPATARAATLRDSGRPAQHVQLVETHGRRLQPFQARQRVDTVPVGPGHAIVQPPTLRRVEATPDALRALVRTYRGEGEGEPIAFLFGLAHAACNRVTSTDPRFARDTSLTAAFGRPGQFEGYAHQPPMPVADTVAPSYLRVLLFAAQTAVDDYNRGDDVTHGAEMFAAVGTLPAWTHQADCTTRIGRHAFWRLRG